MGECPPSSRTTVPRAFLLGLTRSSLPVILGGIAVALGSLALLARTVDLATLRAAPPGVWLESPRDIDCLVTLRAAEVDAHRPEPRGVAIVGASGILQALPEDDELQALFEEEFQTPVPCHNLCMPFMGLPEYFAVVGAVAPKVGGAIVLNVGMRQLLLTSQDWQEARDRPRVGLPSAALDAELALQGMTPRRTGNYLLDYRNFVLPRLLPALRHLLLGSIQPRRYLNLQREEDLAASLPRALAMSRTLTPRFHATAPENLASLGRLVDLIRSCSSADVVLLESTWNPEFLEQFPMDEYRQAMQEFARVHAVAYWDLNEEAGLLDTEFVDFAHLSSPEARRRYTRELARRVATLVLGDRL